MKQSVNQPSCQIKMNNTFTKNILVNSDKHNILGEQFHNNKSRYSKGLFNKSLHIKQNKQNQEQSTRIHQNDMDILKNNSLNYNSNKNSDSKRIYKSIQKINSQQLSQCFNKDQLQKMRLNKLIKYLQNKCQQLQSKISTIKSQLQNQKNCRLSLQQQLQLTILQSQHFRQHYINSTRAISNLQNKTKKQLLQKQQKKQLATVLKFNKLMQIIKRKDQQLNQFKLVKINEQKIIKQKQTEQKQVHKLRQIVFRYKSKQNIMQKQINKLRNKQKKYQNTISQIQKQIKNDKIKMNKLQQINIQVQCKLRNKQGQLKQKSQQIKQLQQYIKQMQQQSSKVQHQFKQLINSYEKQVTFLLKQFQIKSSIVQSQTSKLQEFKNNHQNDNLLQNVQLTVYMKDISKILKNQMGCYNMKKIKYSQQKIYQIINKINDGWIHILQSMQINLITSLGKQINIKNNNFKQIINNKKQLN